MEMTDARWRFTNAYAEEVFGGEDQVLRQLGIDAEAAGLPGWAVSAVVGRALMLVTSMTRGRLALEIGTLGGYSAIWIARGLAEGGRLMTIEIDEMRADFAEDQFAKAGLADRITVHRGDALVEIQSIGAEAGSASLDVVFIDADKESYPAYWRAVRPLVAPGGVVIVDNIFGTGASWIDQPTDFGTTATDEMNRMIAHDPEFEATGLAVRSGLLLARRRPFR